MTDLRMNKITLNAREIEEVYQFFNKMNESSEITLEQSENTGSGCVLKATVYVTHNDVVGDFTVSITDENDW